MKIILRVFGIIVLLLLLFFSYIWITLPDISQLVKYNPKTTALIEQRRQEAKEKQQKLRIRQKWISFKQIPQMFKRCVRISEDAGFYFHEGID